MHFWETHDKWICRRRFSRSLSIGTFWSSLVTAGWCELATDQPPDSGWELHAVQVEQARFRAMLRSHSSQQCGWTEKIYGITRHGPGSWEWLKYQIISNQKVSESFIYCKSHFIVGASIYPHILGLLPLNFATLPISVRTLRVKCTFSQYFALGEQRVKTLSWSTSMAFYLVVSFPKKHISHWVSSSQVWLQTMIIFNHQDQPVAFSVDNRKFPRYLGLLEDFHLNIVLKPLITWSSCCYSTPSQTLPSFTDHIYPVSLMNFTTCELPHRSWFNRSSSVCNIPHQTWAEVQPENVEFVLAPKTPDTRGEHWQIKRQTESNWLVASAITWP